MTTRHIIATTVLGDRLKFRSLEGTEKLSELFHYTVDLLSDRCDLDLEQLLGTRLDISVEIEQGKRYFQGLITDAQFVESVALTDRAYVYRFVVRPWLWLASQNIDNRIFQELSVPAIIDKVLAKYPFAYELRLYENYREWPYCVQYGESDFHFISRLIELEGIYFYVEHSDGEHKLIFTDYHIAHRPLPAGSSKIRYYADTHSLPSHGAYLRSWGDVDSLYSNQHSMVDYDFQKTTADLNVSYSLTKNGAKTMEIYDPLPGYSTLDDGYRYVRIAAESEAWKSHTITAKSNYPLLSCGYTFEVDGVEGAQNPYLIIGTEFNLRENLYATDGGATEIAHHMEVTLCVLPQESQFRAPKITPVPKAQGPMTAKVVGIEGEEIWTDKYGRVKVQFHWDRVGQLNEKSSCWLRVSSPWAGGGFGGVQIPRIDDEVIVGFIGGQIDRPIVIGRVYNALNMPALEFPANATQSGTVTRSKYGDASTANAMLLEDKPNNERLGFQAQKDMDTLVKNNEDINVVGQQVGEHGGTTDLSVGGYDDNIFKAASTESNYADQQRTIAGVSDETVTGPRTHHTGSNAVINMQRGYVQNVSGGLASYTYGAGRDRTVETDYTHSAESTVTRKVSGNVTSKVGTGYSKTVTDGPMRIESGPTDINVSGETVIDSKVKHDSKAGSDVSVKAPNISERAPIVIENYNNELSLTGFKNLMALSSQVTGNFGLGLTMVSEAAQINKLSANALKFNLTFDQEESTNLKGELMGVKLKVVGKKGHEPSVKTEITGIVIDNP